MCSSASFTFKFAYQVTKTFLVIPSLCSGSLTLNFPHNVIMSLPICLLQHLQLPVFLTVSIQFPYQRYIHVCLVHLLPRCFDMFLNSFPKKKRSPFSSFLTPAFQRIRRLKQLRQNPGFRFRGERETIQLPFGFHRFHPIFRDYSKNKATL